MALVAQSLRGFFAASVLVCSSLALAQGTMELNVGMYRIEAEVANSDMTREIGLMNRPAMPAHHGMLFVFPEEMTHCMWMKNTLMPLSVAFMDAKGVIINIEEMAPQTLDNHCARRPARYALEMNAKWFSQKGIKAGSIINGTQRAPAPR